MKNVIKIEMVILGTLIGAGFASGREIYLFFSRYGEYGKLGIILSGIITGVIVYQTLKITKEKEIKDYSNLLKTINPKWKKTNKLMGLIVNAFLLISFYIMVAGFSAYIKQTFEIPTYISSVFFVLFCYLIFRKSLQGMMKINAILVPFLLILICYLGAKNIPYLLENNSCFEVQNIKKGWLFSSILYASYNSIILIPVLVTMKDYLKTKKQIKYISLITIASIITLSFCIHGLLQKGQFFISELELPLIEITLQFGKIFRYLYGFVIIASIFTSAISTGYSFLKNVSKTTKIYNRNLLLITLTSIAISNIGFSNLVEFLYPLFGILGMVQIIFICYYNF